MDKCSGSCNIHLKIPDKSVLVVYSRLVPRNSSSVQFISVQYIYSNSSSCSAKLDISFVLTDIKILRKINTI